MAGAGAAHATSSAFADRSSRLPLPCSHLHADECHQRQGERWDLHPHRLPLLVSAPPQRVSCLAQQHAGSPRQVLTAARMPPMCAAKPGRRTGASGPPTAGRWTITTAASRASECTTPLSNASAVAGARPSRSCCRRRRCCCLCWQGAERSGLLSQPACLPHSTHHRVWIDWPCTQT